MNKSERMLNDFCIHRKINKCIMHFALRPQGDSTTISKLPINLCTISSHGRNYHFGGISEEFYDKMVDKYHYQPK